MAAQGVQLHDGDFTLLEFPGFVRNVGRALDMLGGETAVPAIVRGSGAAATVVALRLREKRDTAHPVLTDTPGPSDTRTLVLRVSQRLRVTTAATGDGVEQPQPEAGRAQSASPCTQMLGSAVTTLRFTGLADAQYVPVDRGLASWDFSALPPHQQPASAEPTGAPQPLLLIPQTFCRTDRPIDYAYKPFAFQGDQKARERKVRSVSYYDAGVPEPSGAVVHGASNSVTPAPHDDGLTEAVEGRQGPALPPQPPASAWQDRVAGLLASRPVWSYAMLAHAVPPDAHPHIMPVLCALAYRFKSGPWRGLYIRRGYDPRTDPEGGKRLQGVTYTLPRGWWERAGLLSHLAPGGTQPAWRKALAADTRAGRGDASAANEPAANRPVAPTVEQLNRFQALPHARTTLLQLCDLDDGVVAGVLLHSQPSAAAPPPPPQEAAAGGGDDGSVVAALPPPRCNPETGWLSRTEWRLVQERVDARFGALLDDAAEQGEGGAVPAAAPARTPAETPSVAAEAAAESEAASSRGSRGSRVGSQGGRSRGRARGRGGRGGAAAAVVADVGAEAAALHDAAARMEGLDGPGGQEPPLPLPDHGAVLAHAMEGIALQGPASQAAPPGCTAPRPAGDDEDAYDLLEEGSQAAAAHAGVEALPFGAVLPGAAGGLVGAGGGAWEELLGMGVQAGEPSAADGEEDGGEGGEQDEDEEDDEDEDLETDELDFL